MKNRSIIALLFLSVTGIAFAQVPVNNIDTIKDSTAPAEVILNKPYDDSKISVQRHPSSDLVIRVVNANSDNLPVWIQYQDNKETSIFVKEIQEELVQYGFKVTTKSSEQAMPPNESTRYDCKYEIKDGLFVITVYPQKAKQ